MNEGFFNVCRSVDATGQFEAWCDANPHHADAARRALDDLEARREAGERG